MSLELKGTHASARLVLRRWPASDSLVPPPSARDAPPALGVPSELQKEHPRHRQVMHMASASAGSHELLHAIVLTSPAIPEWQVAEHM